MVLKSRPIVTMAGVSRYFKGGRMAEWLRSAHTVRCLCYVVGSNTRSHILSLLKKSIGWADGAKVTSRRYYGRRKPLAILRGQDGRVVKASRHCEVLMLSRGIKYQVAHLVSTQKVHRLGGWC